MNDIFATGCEALEFLHDETARVYRAHDDGPKAGSQAEIELSVEGGRVMVETALSQGVMLLEVTADQTIACKKTLSNPVQTFAPWTCARAALESSALGCWLMDPHIDRKIRIQRSFAFRYEGLLQQKKYLRAIGENNVADEVVKRIHKVEQDALALDYSLLSDKKGKRTGIGQPMPTVTEIIRQTLSKEEHYRLFSGVAHAHFWALNNLSLQPVSGNPVPQSRGGQPGKGAYLEKTLKPISVAVLVINVMDSLAQVVWCRFTLLGWPLDPLKEALEKAYNKMMIKKSYRFWRKK